MSIEHELSNASWTNELNAKGNGTMPVFFYTRQVPNTFKSKQEGRPIFDEVVFIKKLIPGDSTFTYDQPMKEGQQEEYAVEWQRFLQKKSVESSGTPLDVWPELTDGQRAEFRALNIFTVEQFAGLPDSAGSKIMGLNHLREQARLFISRSKNVADDARSSEMAAKIEQMQQDNDRLRQMLEKLLAAQTTAASAARRRGRPPKVVMEGEPVAA